MRNFFSTYRYTGNIFSFLSCIILFRLLIYLCICAGYCLLSVVCLFDVLFCCIYYEYCTSMTFRNFEC